ncbi:MAG: metallothionein [Campylobacterales bacterium]|nr:metallothionein [Campylobacterales bacterium]
MFSIGKLLVFAAVLTAIYFIFFKKKKKSNDTIEDTMVECQDCGVFTSSKDTILKDGKYYCSKECAKVK